MVRTLVEVLGLSLAVEREGVGVVGGGKRGWVRRVGEGVGGYDVHSNAWRMRNSNAGYA